jgi:hypothetical protein
LGEAYTLAGPEDGRAIGPIEKLINQKIETVVIEGVPTERLGDPSDSGGRGRRAEELRRERSSRRDRFKKRDPERPSASTEPFTPATETRAARDSRAPRDRHPPRPDRAPRAEGGKRDERRPREREPREQRDDRGSQVFGFGETAPAFLTRSPRREPTEG